MPQDTPRPWKRLVFAFSKKGASAFIAHLDLMTVFERSLARAGYNARFTEGFNPKPRLEFANPLSLGLSSEEEVAGIDLHDFDSAEDFARRVNASLPEGLRVLRVALVADPGAARRRSLMSLYWGADFQVIDSDGHVRVLRLPASGPSIRKTLQAAGTWESSSATRIATWATDPRQQPVDYFEALCEPSAGSSDLI
jgi:radical SAM-linked protein